jgi:hypothetical protein
MNTKTEYRSWIPVLLCCLSLAFVSGCGDDGPNQGTSTDATRTDAGNSQGHSHQEGPHGGEMLDVGDHAAHLEFLHDHDNGKIVLHVIGEDMKTPLNADNPPVINIKTADGPRQIESRAVEGASVYEATDPELMNADLDGQVILAAMGKVYYIPLPEPHDHAGGAGHAHVHGENTISHTAWTDDCEWFVELDTPSAGKDSGFAAHVTLLETFKPATAGRFRVEARSGSEVAETQAGAPARPGIFTPTIRFPKAGEWTLKLLFDGAGIQDSIDWTITVLDAGAQPEPEEDEEGLISFLKEQQWKVPFDTATVERRTKTDGEPGLFVPASSVVKTAGGNVVFVQADGESFERRSIKTGSSQGTLVEILSGIEGGERIVVKGAEHLLGG